MTNLDPVEGGRKAGSWTWAGLYNTHYWLDPESGMAAVFMTQLLPFADERTLRVYRNYELAVYRALAAL